MRGISFHMAVSILIASVAAAAISMPLASSLEEPIYEMQINRLNLSPGSIGSEAGDNIPIARSIEDMGEMEKFTLEVEELDRGAFLDETYYHRVQLDSGEKVAVLLNKASIREVDNGNRLRLPVGRWIKWEHSTKEKSEYKEDYQGFYTDFSYYVDMEGDFNRISSASEISRKLFILFMTLFGFPILCFIRWIGVKRGWFPPEFFKKKYEQKAKETQAVDDTEKWALAVCAIEASCMGDENLIAGLPKTLRNQNKAAKILATRWAIYNADKGRNRILQLADVNASTGTDRASLAWNCCQAMQLIGFLFLCDYIHRQEMRSLFCQVGRNIQENFASWTDLCGHSLKGYADWRRTFGGHAEKDIEERKRVYHSLKKNPNGPYHLPFKTSLSEEISNEDIVRVALEYLQSQSDLKEDEGLDALNS